jgi:hypothetical protein
VRTPDPWLVQSPSLRSDRHTAFAQDAEHRRFANPYTLSHVEAREPGHVEILDLSAVPLSDPVLRWTRRALTWADGTEMERNRGVALQLSEGYERKPASGRGVTAKSEAGFFMPTQLVRNKRSDRPASSQGSATIKFQSTPRMHPRNTETWRIKEPHAAEARI